MSYLHIGKNVMVSRRRIIGVFDLDSPVQARFDAQDQAGLEAIALAYVESLR